MISQDLIDKYKNHLNKAKKYDLNDFADLYDSYLTLFTEYNMLYNYNEVSSLFNTSNTTWPGKKDIDSQKATFFVSQYLSAEVILEALTKNGNDKDVDDLIKILPIFNIKLSNGVPQKNIDTELLINLQSNIETEKSLAILQVIYNVRCNMIHGSKDFQEYQRLLIEPLGNILKTINELLFNSLNR